MKSIRVFVVEDHELMRIGISEGLDAEPDIEIVGDAAQAQGAAARISALRPDVVLLDIRLGDGSGIQLCREVLAADSSIRCLMLTSATGDGPLLESVLAGASGYLLKGSSRDVLVGAVRLVADGGSLIDPATTERMMSLLRKAHQDSTIGLTDQERKVLDRIGRGLTNQEIADELHLAHQTVKNYVSRVLTKLGMDRTQAALHAAASRDQPDY